MNYSILFKLLEEGFFSQQHYFCGSQGADPSWAAKRVRGRFHQRCTKLSPNRDWQGQCHADPATLLITFTGLYWKVLWKVPWPSNPDLCCKRSALLRMSVLISTAFAKSSASCSLFVSHSPFGANVAWILDMSHHGVFFGLIFYQWFLIIQFCSRQVWKSGWVNSNLLLPSSGFGRDVGLQNLCWDSDQSRCQYITDCLGCEHEYSELTRVPWRFSGVERGERCDKLERNMGVKEWIDIDLCR